MSGNWLETNVASKAWVALLTMNIICRRLGKASTYYWALGFSLAETLIVLVLIATLLALAAPAFQNMTSTQRARAAADTLHAKLYAAKSEAIKRNAYIYATFKTKIDGTWCYGFKWGTPCDCNVTGSCQIDGEEKTVRSNDYPGVAVELHISSPGDRFAFDGGQWNMYGTFGHVRFISNDGKQIRVIVSRMGRLRKCSPAGAANIPGYSTTC